MKNSILIGLSIVLGIVFSTIVSAQDVLNTNKTYIDTFGNGKPMAVYIGADWCKPCQRMKEGPLKLLKSNLLTNKFNYLELDVDRDRELVKAIHRGTKVNGLKIPHILFIQRNGKTRVSEGFVEYYKLESIFRSEAKFYGRDVQP